MYNNHFFPFSLFLLPCLVSYSQYDVTVRFRRVGTITHTITMYRPLYVCVCFYVYASVLLPACVWLYESICRQQYVSVHVTFQKRSFLMAIGVVFGIPMSNTHAYIHIHSLAHKRTHMHTDYTKYKTSTE